MQNYNKERYIDLCKSEKSIPIFSQNWWMDAVCGRENWDVAIVEENGKVIGSHPFYLKASESGLTIQKAPLTQNNGIWIYYPEDIKYEKRLSYEKKIMNNIIDQIENLELESYRQYFYYSVENWLPYHWRGYNQTTRYTYVIEDTSDLEMVENSFNSNIRNYIRKAGREVDVLDDMSIEDFFNLNKMTFLRQGMDIPYSLDTLKKIDGECRDRNLRKILYAVDKYNNIHSAAYFAWDNNAVYYLMSGSDPNFRSSQSLTLLIYEGIKLASLLNRKFDFEGSMKENIENFFRQFGATQKPYHNISKTFNKTLK
jgi:hypothetical protein